MRRSSLLALPFLAALGCGEGTPTSINGRPTLRVEERFGQLAIINTSEYPLYTMPIDASDPREYLVQAGNDADYVLVQPGDARVVDPSTVLGGKPVGRVRVFYFFDGSETPGIQRVVTMNVVAEVGRPTAR